MRTPSPIQRLPTQLINQIAAGEVIERPANAVKELVENAIDAGADQISVNLGDGGRAWIEVRDNGHGIAEADLPLAFERHCTSKIASIDALFSLDSLGFRGEALASLAAVSTLTVTTRTAAARSGLAARFVNGRVVTEPTAHPPGTTIRVTDLFAELPARRQFLKAASAELVAIESLFRQVAFATPHVRFELHHNGRCLKVIPAAGRLDRARLGALFGARFVAQARTLEATGAVRIEGLFSPPEAARNRADLQVLAVNGRAVRDRQLQHAIRAAYAESLPPGLHPAYAIAIALTPADLDVNVHPAKLEVRFADIRDVHDQLFAAVKGALDAINGPRALPQASMGNAPQTKPHPSDTQPERDLDAQPADWPRASGSGAHTTYGGRTPAHSYSGLVGEPRRASASVSTSGLGVRRGRSDARSGHSCAPVAGSQGALVGGRYRIRQTLQALEILDLQAVIMLRVEALFEEAGGKLHSETQANRPLLLPVTLDDPPPAELLRLMQGMGFIYRREETHIVLTAVPRWCPPLDAGLFGGALEKALGEALAAPSAMPNSDTQPQVSAVSPGDGPVTHAAWGRALGQALARAWTGELNPLLEHWAEMTPEACRALDASTIAQLWSTL